MKKLGLNTSTILGFTSAIAIAGMSFKNSYLTFTGINLGISVGIANIANKKTKYEQEKQLYSQINYLTNKIKTIEDQFQLSAQYPKELKELKLQLKESLKRIDDNNANQQFKIQALDSQYQNNIEEQQQLNKQIDYLVNQIKDIKDQAKTKQQDKLDLDLRQLNFKIDNRERQLNKHNIQLKKHQHELNSQKSNQNKILSQIQKLKNKQGEILTIDAQYLNELERQIDNINNLFNSNQDNTLNLTIKKKRLVSIDKSIDIKPETLVYIDANNLYNCLKKINIEVDYQALFSELAKAMNATQIKIYDGAFPNQTDKYLELKRLGYQVTTLPIIQRGQNAYKTIGDDVKLAIDMVKEVKSGDRVILITGDGDFCPVVKDIKERNVHVTVMAEKSSISPDLRELADKFISLNSFGYKIAKHTRF